VSFGSLERPERFERLERVERPMLLRALLAFLVLPGVVAFAVPLFIVWSRVREGTFNAVALVLFVPGIALLIWCVRDFLVTGKGTLAPWDPPRNLVSSGPYRYSRNPMYVGVSLILWGWAIAFASWALVLYALIVMMAFHVRVLLHEEPYLARTHGRRWDDYRAHVPRWVFPSRRAVMFSWAALIMVLALAGLTFEAYADAEAAREFPAPGTMVDIGGRRLHLVCVGREEPMDPTVMFLSSGWGNSMSSSRARERLGTRTRVCSHDYLGRGWSDAAPSVTTIGAMADDLGVLQDRAMLTGPFVLVASSVGGLVAEMFTRRYPERVAGIVFVDAAGSWRIPRIAGRRWTVTALACTAGVLSRFGVIRLMDPFAIGDETEGERRSAAITYGARPWTATCALARGISATQREFEQAPPLSPGMPVTVLSASSTRQLLPSFAEHFIDVQQLRAEGVASHREMAERLHGSWKEIPNSTHLIADSQPDAVADAVFDMLDQLRSAQR
jgi:protein-S-isoprenylcysteine O-methyltransferase Ste14/pimeloyl-ACP methyl ester carboxylesterase